MAETNISNIFNEYEIISVREAAKRIGCTPQTIYNQIKAGIWETVEYNRGKYKGVLVKLPVKN